MRNQPYRAGILCVQSDGQIHRSYVDNIESPTSARPRRARHVEELKVETKAQKCGKLRTVLPDPPEDLVGPHLPQQKSVDLLKGCESIKEGIASCQNCRSLNSPHTHSDCRVGPFVANQEAIQNGTSSPPMSRDSSSPDSQRNNILFCTNLDNLQVHKTTAMRQIWVTAREERDLLPKIWTLMSTVSQCTNLHSCFSVFRDKFRVRLLLGDSLLRNVNIHAT